MEHLVCFLQAKLIKLREIGETMVKEYKAKELSHLLSLANDMREANGDEKLDYLPASLRGAPQSCIIARAFNYSCAVYPGYSKMISFKTHKDAETYCNIVGIDKSRISSWIGYTTYDAPLTDELNSIAMAFDEGRYHTDGF